MSNESSEDGAILITGGTGFIGSHLARELVAKGNKVVLFDYRPNENRISDLLDKVDIVKGDITSVSNIVDTLKDYSIKDVFHTAFAMSAECETNLEIAYSTNIRGTYNLLDACRILGIKKFIFLSSLSVLVLIHACHFQRRPIVIQLVSMESVRSGVKYLECTITISMN